MIFIETYWDIFEHRYQLAVQFSKEDEQHKEQIFEQQLVDGLIYYGLLEAQ